MRAPYQVLIIPYRRVEESYEFAIFNRSDMNCWQWISGGGEDFDTSIIESARREAYEEANILQSLEYNKLDSITSIPAGIFGKELWGKDVYVIPEYSFAVEIGEAEPKLSDEHKEFKWVNYEEACKLLKYDSNRTALWELTTRLENSQSFR